MYHIKIWDQAFLFKKKKKKAQIGNNILKQSLVVSKAPMEFSFPPVLEGAYGPQFVSEQTTLLEGSGSRG